MLPAYDLNAWLVHMSTKNQSLNLKTQHNIFSINSSEQVQQQQQPFYGPLIQDNAGEPVPETLGNINSNPAIIILLSTSNQSSLFIMN